MREVEVFPDSPVGKVRFFLIDTRDKMALECRCARHGGRLVRLFALGNFRVFPKSLVRDDLVSKFIQRAMKAAPAAGATAPPDAYFAEAYPAVWEFVTVTHVDLDGLEMKRQTATMSIFAQDGLWKVFLNDRETKQCVCVAAVTFTALLEVLEATLQGDEVPWRAMTQAGGTARQKAPRKPTGQG